METTEESLGKFLEGALAYGWGYDGAGQVDLELEPLRGWVRLAADGDLEYEVLVDDPFPEDGRLDQPTAPSNLVLLTRHGAALLLDVRERVGWNLNMMGSKASVHIYKAPAMLFGLDLDDVTTSRIKRLSVRFVGLGGWAGLDLTQTDVQHDQDGLVTAANLKLKSAPSVRLARALPQTLDLEMAGDWIIGRHEAGQQIVTTALKLTVEAKRARDLTTLAQPFYDIQDLLALLHGGVTLATPTNLRAGEKASAVLFWDAQTMRRHPRMLVARQDTPAALTLADLGGLRGLARWCDLTRDHRDVTHALTSVYRTGPETVEVRLLRLGVAFEFWVARHARTAKWASTKGKPKGWTYAHSIASRLGDSFTNYVGDVDAWSTAFWDAYLDSKHLRGRGGDPEMQYILAMTGRWALAATLLDRVAGSRAPSQRLLASHGVVGFGNRFQEMTASANP